MDNNNTNAAVLFDFDGVVVDTETQYSVFWHRIGADYLGMDDLETRIKGQTLPYIYDTPVIPLSDALFDFFTDLFRIAIKSKRLSELVFQAEQKQSFYY